MQLEIPRVVLYLDPGDIYRVWAYDIVPILEAKTGWEYYGHSCESYFNSSKIGYKKSEV
jgi:hypothetical protein